MTQVVPVMRIFDEEKAKAFYLGFLDGRLVFEHRFGENLPLYMAVAVVGCELHLSEHHGDASPGAHIRFDIDDVTGFSEALAAKGYKYARPGPPEETPWGTRELTLTDPFGNRLTFCQEG